MDYLHLFSPLTAEVCEPQQRCISKNSEWTWNKYQNILKGKVMHQKRCICGILQRKWPAKPKTDVYDVGLRASLSAARDDGM